MFRKYIPWFQQSLVFLIMLLAAACQGARQTTLSLMLEPDKPMLINFPLIASAQIYSFRGNPKAATQITLLPMTADLPYTAEVHDNQGRVMAMLGSHFRNAILTIGPSDGMYDVAIQSDNHDLEGALSVLVSTVSANNPSTTAVNFTSIFNPSDDASLKTASLVSNNAGCSARSSTGGNVNIRGGPGMEHTIIASLIVGNNIAILGRSDTNWFAVDVNGQPGWISGTVIALAGNCNALPVMAVAAAPTPIPTPLPTLIPLDPQAFHMAIESNGWGNFSDSIVYTDVERRDLIQMDVVELSSQQTTDYREYTLTLVCSGNGSDTVRWGAVDQPTLQCGHSIVMPFTADFSRQTIAVSLPEVSGQSAVTYTLLAAKK